MSFEDDAEDAAYENRIKNNCAWNALNPDVRNAAIAMVSGICAIPDMTNAAELAQKFYEKATKMLNEETGAHFHNEKSYMTEAMRSVGRQAQDFRSKHKTATHAPVNRLAGL